MRERTSEIIQACLDRKIDFVLLARTDDAECAVISSAEDIGYLADRADEWAKGSARTQAAMQEAQSRYGVIGAG